MKQLIGGGSGPAGPAGPAGAITAVPAGTAAAPSIAFEGDSNTGIYSPGADQVAISTNGTEKLIVKSDGKVGLGTSSPSQLFHLAANNCNLHLQPVSNAEARIQAEGGTAGTGTAITFHNYNGVSNGERVRIDGSGRVGIGTTSPNGPLEVIGTAATIAARATTGVSSKAIQIYNDGTDSYIDSTAYGAGSGGGIAFRKNGTGEMGRFDTSGRLLVGVSTTSDNNALLQVSTSTAGSTGGSIVIRNGAANTAGNMAELVFKTSVGFTSGFNSAKIAAIQTTTAEAVDLAFYTYGAGLGTEAMRIKSTRIINLSNAPTHADNTAATAAGLAVGDVYKTVLGVLMIRF